MNRRSLLSFFCTAFLVAVAAIPIASAQDGPDIFITPIPNAPFSGVVNVERSMVQRDGSVVDFRTIREISRDTRGRVHNEARELVSTTSNKKPPLVHVHLYDPQTRISTMLYPKKKTFRTQTLSHPPAAFPPDRRYASSGGEGPQNEFANQEDLGTREMEGVSVHGIRESQSIPAENGDAGKEVVVTDEYWYSEDLRINLMIKHNDPRTGTVTMTVTQITRIEPDAALFEIPDGYKQIGATERAAR